MSTSPSAWFLPSLPASSFTSFSAVASGWHWGLNRGGRWRGSWVWRECWGYLSPHQKRQPYSIAGHRIVLAGTTLIRCCPCFCLLDSHQHVNLNYTQTHPLSACYFFPLVYGTQASNSTLTATLTFHCIRCTMEGARCSSTSTFAWFFFFTRTGIVNNPALSGFFRIVYSRLTGWVWAWRTDWTLFCDMP